MGFFREFRFELGALFFGLGIVAMFLAITQIFFPTQSPPWLQSIHAAIGAWIFWVGILGFFALLGGGYYFFDTIRKEREFERLLSTTSKETFLKNMGRMEELAYYHLPASYERQFREKKREFRIKA